MQLDADDPGMPRATELHGEVTFLNAVGNTTRGDFEQQAREDTGSGASVCSSKYIFVNFNANTVKRKSGNQYLAYVSRSQAYRQGSS